MMIGICDSARTLRHRLRPSSPGSITSRMSRSTRWSDIARTISRPSIATVTLQPLPRRYFAISDRVSRSAATTRMFGDAVAMQGFGRDSRTDDFCFVMFLTLASQHDATRQAGNKKTSLRPLTLTLRYLARTFGAFMTSISATSGTNYLSPLQLLQNELQTEASSGAISSTDQSALSSVLNDINSSLQNNSPSTSTGGANASPGDLKSKIDTLIAGEVSSGNLTRDRATERQGTFAAAFANGSGGASRSTSVGSANAAGGGVAPAG